MTNRIETSENLTPETEAARDNQTQAGCCGGAAPRGSDACCALDAGIKSKGGSGCGCSARAANGARQKGGCC